MGSSLAGISACTDISSVFRERAIALNAAAAAALAALLRRLQERGAEVNSEALLQALLCGHATCCAAPESAAAVLGRRAGPAGLPLLQVDLLEPL